MSEVAKVAKSVEKLLAKKQIKEEIKQIRDLPYKTVYANKFGETQKEIDTIVSETLSGIKSELMKVENNLNNELKTFFNNDYLTMNDKTLLDEYYVMNGWKEGEAEVKIRKGSKDIGWGSTIQESTAKELIAKIFEDKNKTALNYLKGKPNMASYFTKMKPTLIAEIVNKKIDNVMNIIKNIKSLDAGANETKTKIIDSLNQLKANVSAKMEILKDDISEGKLHAKEFIDDVKAWFHELFKPQNLIFIFATLGTLTAVVSGRPPNKIEAPKKP